MTIPEPESTILLEAEGVRVGVGDLGHILDLGNQGVLPVDSLLLEQAEIIARQAVYEYLEQATALIEQSDNKFPRKDLLKRLSTLNEASDDTSTDELSSILHVLDPGGGKARYPSHAEAIFPTESIPELIEFYEDRITYLTTHIETISLSLENMQEDGNMDTPEYEMATNNSNGLEAELIRCQHELWRLREYLEPY